MRRQVTRVDPLSASRVLALLLFVQGFVIGAIALGLRVAGIDLPLPMTPPPGGNTITLLLWTPLSFGAVGVVSGGILATTYNFVAKRFGGIEYEMEKSI
jgi:hypothetical protein